MYNDIIAEYRAFALITSRSSVLGGKHQGEGGVETALQKDPFDDLPDENFAENLMQAGFIMPLPNVTAMSVTQKLNGVGDASIDIFHPYREGDFTQHFTKKGTPDDTTGESKLETVSLPYMRKEAREFLGFPPIETEVDGNPVTIDNDLEGMYGDFEAATNFMLGYSTENKSWKDIIKKRADILTKVGLGDQLLGALGLGGGDGNAQEYLKDYLGYKYVVNLEDMTPVWVVGRVREDIEDPALKKIQEYIKNKAEADDKLTNEQKKIYGQMWVFAFHGYISKISESWSPQGVSLKLSCKSFLEYLNRMELQSNHRIVDWMASPQDKLMKEFEGSGGFSSYLQDWWTDKSVHEVMSYIPTLANAVHTYRGMKRYNNDSVPPGDNTKANFANYFHYDYFFLPTKDEAKNIADDNNEEITYDNISGLTKMLTAYRGSYLNITHPMLAEDIHWMSQENRSLEELAIRWWFTNGDVAKERAGSGTYNPDADLNPSYCMRNRWKARTYIDPYIADVNVFNEMIRASYQLEDTGATKTALRVLDDFRARIFGDYFTDGRGNFIFASKRWDDIPRFTSGNVQGAAVKKIGEGVSLDIRNGWSPLDAVSVLVNDPNLFPIYVESDTLVGAVYGDHNERYIIDDILQSWNFEFNEGDVKTHAEISSSVNWVRYNQLVQLIGATSHATLDGDLFSYVMLKYGDRRLTADIQNAGGLFGKAFMADANAASDAEGADHSSGFQTAFMLGLMRESLAKANTGSVTLGHRPDLQLGRVLYFTDRQKKGYPTSIRHQWKADSRSSTTISMFGCADVSQIWGNPLLEAWAVQGFTEVVSRLREEKLEKLEKVKTTDGTVIAVPDGYVVPTVLDDLDGEVSGIPNVEIARGDASNSPATSTKCVKQLELAIREWVDAIDIKMQVTNPDADWKLMITSVYRAPGTTAGDDENGAIDSTDTYGHYSGNAFDVDVKLTIATMVGNGLTASAAEGFLFNGQSIVGSSTIWRQFYNRGEDSEWWHVALRSAYAVEWERIPPEE